MTPCKLCGGPTQPVMQFGDLPLVNRLLDYPDEPFSRYPLDLLFCEACALGQLAETVPPESMFEDYTYFTSINQPMVQQAYDLAHEVLSELTCNSLHNRALVVEIGSNDGYLLRNYKRMGIPILGIDPARGPANAAALIGVPTLQAFFTTALASSLPKADVIHAHNVLAHVPDLDDFVRGLATMLKPSGVLIVEVPDFSKMVERCEFDTTYHEHVYYFTFRSLELLFARHGLHVFRAEEIDAHGGSLRLWFRSHSDIKIRLASNLDGLPSFRLRAQQLAFSLNSTLNRLASEGHSVWGFGAAAKATVMLNYAGIDSSLIQKIADDTPAKRGKFIPGTGIEIVPSTEWLAAAPDYTCIFAWNYSHLICNRYSGVYSGGFFTPYILPMVEVNR